MATYLVWSGGNNSSGTEASGWANAYTAFGSAVTAASTNGDIIKVHKTHQEELAGDTTYTFSANVNVICVDKDSSDALSEMGTGGWIGNSTTNRTVAVTATAKNVYLYGVTIRTAGSTLDVIQIGANTVSYSITCEKCYLWNGNTNTGGFIRIGAAGLNNASGKVILKYTTFRFGAAQQFISLSSNAEITGGIISGDGSAITTCFKQDNANDTGGTYAIVTGMDLSAAATTANLVGDSTIYNSRVDFSNCKLPSSFVGLASQTDPTLGTAEAFVFNCSGGDNHYEFGHYNAFGSTVAVTSPYISDGALYDGTNHVTWKIVTAATASIYVPYVSPWIETYHAGTTAITPSIEGLMIDDATVAHNNEVWGEFSYQGSTGSALATIVNDRMTLLGSSAAQTSSKTYSDWTASPATDAGDSVFKLATTATITPAEIGMLRARVCVGEASKTLYIDPKIRT